MTLQEKYKDDPRREKLMTREAAIRLLMEKIELKAKAKKQAEAARVRRERIHLAFFWLAVAALLVFTIKTGPVTF